METVLPNEMIGEVMKYLSNSELAIYGQSSKTTLQSSELEWKVRYNKLQGEKTENDGVNPLVYWMKNYSVNIVYNFRTKMTEMLAEFNTSRTSGEKKSSISKMLDFIIENPTLVFENNQFKKFRKAVDEKLYELMMDDSGYEIAQKYYPIIFPERYKIVLEERNEMIKRAEEGWEIDQYSEDFEHNYD